MSNLYQYNGTEWVEIARNGKDAVIDYAEILSRLPKEEKIDRQKLFAELKKLIPKPETTETIIEKIKDKFSFSDLKDIPMYLRKVASKTVSLIELDDVQIDNPTNGQALSYSATLKKWINTTISASGITLKTNGTPNIDQTVLDIVAGTNMTITDNGDGSVTFDATGDSGSGTVTSVSVTTANGISGTVTNPTTTPAISLDITGLDASKIANGTVSNTEFQYLGNVTSDIQTQLNAKEAALTFSTGLTRSADTITSDLSTGISGGQSVIGGTGASENLTLSSTSNATKGKMLFGTSTYDEVNNRLGVGTASPSYTLDVRGTATGTTGSQILSNVAYITPTAESSASYTSGYYDVSVRPGTGNTIAAGRGAYYQADNDGAGTVTTITGISSYGRNASTGTVINCYGNYALMQNISTGTVTAGYATAGAVQNTNTGTITTGTALSLSLSNSSTGTINTAYGINLSTTNTSGTIANWYGIRITGVSGNAPTTNRYPIYISDTGNNYFAGSLGLGQTTPTAVLHLKAGTASASTAPLKFTAGTVNTTPEAGTMEFTNAEDGLTFTAVSTRRQVVLDTATQTLSGKAITKRVVTTTDDSTAVIDVGVTDVYQLTAIANNTTFSFTGSPTDGQTFVIRYKDAGVSKTLTWTGFTAIGVTLPTATTAGKWGYVGVTYNSAAAAYHVTAVTTEA